MRTRVFGHWAWTLAFAAFFIWNSFKYDSIILAMATGFYLALAADYLYHVYLERDNNGSDDV